MRARSASRWWGWAAAAATPTTRSIPSVGFTEFIDVGTRVRTGSPLCLVHAASEADADEAIARLRKAIRIGEPAPPPRPVVIDRIVE